MATGSIDLTALPPPNVVEVLSFETIVRDMRAIAAAVDPADFAELRESDPALKLIEVFAYRELLIRARVNDAAKGNLLATASGGTLDQMGAWVGITRKVLDPGDPANGIPPTYESDDDFRQRIADASRTWSIAGPRSAYEGLALEASDQVADTYASSPSPGVVQVHVLGPGNAIPAQATLDEVEAYLSAETRRPLTDSVTVLAGEIVLVTVDITVALANTASVQGTIDQMLADWEAWIPTAGGLGAQIARPNISAVLWRSGVEGITFNGDFVSQDLRPATADPHVSPVLQGSLKVSVGGGLAVEIWSA